ncbi:hypothetical protein Rsub_05630 [Raphidocelis subcapitata]|uniref:RIC1 C-terminal alpha solenoid region domain-containing protein n=1 Tax=Raphidocelis subcapitata TaxID=307507 RepID=A0A2V0P0B4_9CHLO|nr:hypothetical protein Rsub_05630 [Raphidocelis subcapitata]|eukprot:GBF93019.1 hypothetical protein Rsub_05630 [Raphidocelis subcapitata]
MGALVPFGWPARLATATDGRDGYILLHADQEFVVAVSEVSVAVWSGGAARVRLGQVHLSQDDVRSFGTHVAACWCPERARLAVLTSLNQVIIYAVSVTQQQPLPGAPVLGPPVGPSARAAGAAAVGGGAFLGEPRELSAVGIYASEAAALPYEAAATAICCDARAVLVGFADGFLAALTWHAKLKSELLDPLGDALDEREEEEELDEEDEEDEVDEVDGENEEEEEEEGEQGEAEAGAGGAARPAQASGAPGQHPLGAAASRRRAIARLELSPAAGALVVVMGDGAAALCRVPARSLQVVEAVEFSHWLCGPEARCCHASIAAPLGLVALGCRCGETLLLRLELPHFADLGDGASSCGLSPVSSVRSFGTPSPFALRERSPLRGAAGEGALVRGLSLADWGLSQAHTGAVAALSWSNDCRALAVGYARQGLAVWTPSGCRVMCTVRQWDGVRTPRASSPTQSGQPPLGGGAGYMDGGAQALAWGPLGYHLLFACTAPHGAAGLEAALPARAATAASGGAGRVAGGGGSQLLEVQFAKAPSGGHRLAQVEGGAQGELHILQAADRLLLISNAAPRNRAHDGSDVAGPGSGAASGPGAGEGEGANDLAAVHVPLPASYLAANWPLVHAAASPSGGDVAVSGRRGLAVYSRRTERWRLFGNVSQERRVSAVALGWLGSCLVACSAPNADAVSAADAARGAARAARAGAGGSSGGAGGGGGRSDATGCQILVFPKHHLEFGSLVASHDLKRVPSCMDCVGNYIITASPPLELLLLHFDARHERLVPVRELSIYNVGPPLRALAIVPPQAPLASSQASDDGGGGGGFEAATALARAAARGAAGPRQALLHRWGGALSVLDLDTGSELPLSTEVECFWLSGGLAVGPAGADSHLSSAPGSAANSRSASAATLHAAARGPLAAAGSAALAGGVIALREALGSLELQRELESGDKEKEESDSQQQDSGVVEMPWWAYGPSGMQLWFPSLLPAAPALAHATSSGTLPRLVRLRSQDSVGSPLALASPMSFSGRAGSPYPPSPPSTAGGSGAAAAAAAAAIAAANVGGGDMELEFDREVYPVGVSLADASIIGVTQRLLRLPMSAAGPGLALPSFHPVPESQPVLPALLRRLLLKGARADAAALAQRHSAGPHFARSLEWLLFTALDMEGGSGAQQRELAASRGALGALNKPWDGHAGGTGPRPVPISRLLADAAELVLSFPPRAFEAAVSVARKTDAALWPALFTAVGSPSALLNALLDDGRLMHAACSLIVVDRLEGAALAQSLALRLVAGTLRCAQYGLCAEILRFIRPPGFKARGTAAAGGGAATTPPAPAAVTFGGAGGGGGGGAAARLRRFGCMPAYSPQPAPAEAAAEGGSSWLGWLWGGGADSPAALSHPSGLHVRTGHGGDGDAGGGGGVVWGGWLASDGGAATAGAEQACHMISDHGWLLLQQGKHAQLARLCAAMAFLQGGLASLMQAYRDSWAPKPPQQQQQPQPPARRAAPARGAAPAAAAARGGAWWPADEPPPATEELVAAVVDAVTELPVWESHAVEEDALSVLALSRALGATKWGVALGVLLVETELLDPFAAAHGDTWAAFCAALAAEPRLHFMRDLVGALASLPSAAAAAAAEGDGGGEPPPPPPPPAAAEGLGAVAGAGAGPRDSAAAAVRAGIGAGSYTGMYV